MIVFSHSGDGFPVIDLRRADNHFDFVFAFHPFNINVEMKLSHSGNMRFSRFRIHFDTKGGIFPHKTTEGLAHPCLRLTVFGINRQ